MASAPSASSVMTRAVAVVGLVLVLAACDSGGDGTTAAPSAPSVATTRQFAIADVADHAACVASARAIEAAALAHYASTGSYGSVDDLVKAGYLKSAPNAAWGLVVG